MAVMKFGLWLKMQGFSDFSYTGFTEYLSYSGKISLVSD
jgi:hypothetical protein